MPVAAILLALAACTNGSATGPAVGQPDDQSTTLGEPVTVQLTIVSEAPATVSVTASSSNHQVLPEAGVELTGTGANRALVLTPSHTESGTSTVTITVTDANGSASREFDLEVGAPFSDHLPVEPTNDDPIGVSLALRDSKLVVGGLESAYVFELQGEQWNEVQKLEAPQNGISDVQGYGGAVAVDGARILVGADETTNTNASQGAAFLYEKAGATYELEIDLLDNDPAASELLGRSVAVLGDDVFAGVPGGSSNNVQSGTVNAYVPDGLGSWTLLGKLTPSDAVAGTVFGDALDAAPGLVVVGDYGNDERGTDAGAAYVFAPDGGFWTELIKLAPAELESQDQFGNAVAADDGWIVVSAWNDDAQAEDAGAAYVFQDGGSGWTQVDVLYASDAAENGGFGSSVALDYPYAVVGAYLEDSAGNNAGAVYVFRHDGTSWHQVAKLTAPAPAANAGFGWAVDISGGLLGVTQFSPPRTFVYSR